MRDTNVFCTDSMRLEGAVPMGVYLILQVTRNVSTAIKPRLTFHKFRA